MEKDNLNKKGIAGYWLVTLFVIISFAIVFITGGLLYFMQAPYATNSFERVANEWEKRVVKIECQGEFSTGFIVETDVENGENYAYIMTSQHGVESNLGAVYAKINGQNILAENLSENELIDIAVFKVKCDASFSFAKPAGVKIAQEVIAIGYPDGEFINVEKGIINSTAHVDVNNDGALLCYDVSSYVRKGMSGCPILTQDGKIVGVGVRCKKGTVGEQEVVFSSDNYVVPYEIALAEYDRARNYPSSDELYYQLSQTQDGIQVAFTDGKIVSFDEFVAIDNKEIVKVQNSSVNGIVDFIAKISLYENRREISGKYYVCVTTKDNQEILIQVVSD